MIVFPLLVVNFLMNVVAVFWFVCAIVLVLVILIQKGRGGGLGGVFGGGAAGGIMGSKTGDFLTWVTIGLVGVFLLGAVVLAKWYKPAPGDFGTDQTPQTQAPVGDVSGSPQPADAEPSAGAAAPVTPVESEEPAASQPVPVQETDAPPVGAADTNSPG